MQPPRTKIVTTERNIQVGSGWPWLFIGLAGVLAAIVMFVGVGQWWGPGAIALGIVVLLGSLLLLCGLFTLQPNEARVLILFGNYHGTVRNSGFHWANPFYSGNRGKVPLQAAGTPAAQSHKFGVPSSSGMGIVYHKLPTRISLRVHNFNSEKLKVNDKRGNPVEIAAVVVWRVENTAQAAFDVEDYEGYVQVQSEAAIRDIASQYVYDNGEANEVTLRGGGAEVAHALRNELAARLALAGVVVDDAQLTHLAYAPEIASAMLRRQQAEAIIAAREKIVVGAVGMVHQALSELSAAGVVRLDEERKAAMVSNLLVVLCGTAEASPVINTGTLYT